MDHHVAVVQEDPDGLAVPLPSRTSHAFLLQPLLDVVRNRLELALVEAGDDDEIVGDEGQLVDVEDDDVLGLLVLGDPGAGDGDVAGFDSRYSSRINVLRDA
jgi:hypothetical protein